MSKPGKELHKKIKAVPPSLMDFAHASKRTNGVLFKTPRAKNASDGGIIEDDSARWEVVVKTAVLLEGVLDRLSINSLQNFKE
mmetsp:Transcript_23949/g.36233  ORF Transcript_23949/g.36233 Transcript_23949/m.36233 type:complete len:83 (+) Transcript_23949:1308-1556(+)